MDRRECTTIVVLNLVVFQVVVTVRRGTTILVFTSFNDARSILQHVVINHNIEGTGTKRSHLPKHDVFGNTTAVI